MKIAILYNFLDSIGGAEIVTLTLARELKADIYTTNIDREKIKKMGFSDINIISIGKVPINAPFRQQLTSLRFRVLNLKRRYDFYIISGDWAVSGAMHNKPNLEYVHGALNEIWSLKEYIKRGLNFRGKLTFEVWTRYNRRLHKKYFEHVERITCNSENTKNKIKQYLGRNDVTVIYPPIETKEFHFTKYGDFWLSVNRLVDYKQIDIQMEAFSRLPDEKLIVVGSYEKGCEHHERHKRYLEKIKPRNVELIYWVSYKKLLDLYATCKGFITTSEREDFGMTAVEAMASGKPVIAPNEGGYRESVVDAVTGKLIDDINVEKLIKAIKKIGKNPEKYKNNCIKQAKKFDTKIFIKRIKDQVAV